MNSRAARIGLEDSPVLYERLIECCLTFISFCSRLVAPNRIGSYMPELVHRLVGYVPVYLPCLIKDFGIICVESVQLQSDFNSFVVAFQSRIGAQQLKTTHAPDFRIGRAAKALVQSRQGLFVAAK